MVKLVWGVESEKNFENGLDRGVLYPEVGSGVVWNGLINIEESSIGGESSSYHFDGIKYLETVSPKSFQATLSALYAPEAFSECLGERSIIPGFVLTRQPRIRFGLSYRTLIKGTKDYKLHFVYNSLATPRSRGYRTLSDAQNVTPLTWQIDAVPPQSDIFRPTAHYVLDSRKINHNSLKTVENIAYGSDIRDPRLPTADELIAIVAFWSPVSIVSDVVNGFAQLVPDELGDLYETRVKGVYGPMPNTRLNESPVAGFYRMG